VRMRKKTRVAVMMVVHGKPLPQAVEAGTIRTTKGQAFILPPPKGKCQECAVDHRPDEPHNRDSLYYQMAFRQKHGRWPTWADAIAHCSEDGKKAIRELLEAQGVWSEPVENLTEEDRTARTLGGMPTHSQGPDGGAVFGDVIEVEIDHGKKRAKRGAHPKDGRDEPGKARRRRGGAEERGREPQGRPRGEGGHVRQDPRAREG